MCSASKEASSVQPTPGTLFVQMEQSTSCFKTVVFLENLPQSSCQARVSAFRS